MKNKGFTLIELLAVLTILAIITLIVVPIVSGIVKDSRIESRKRSIDLYGKAAETSIKNAVMKDALNDLSCEDYKTALDDVEYTGSRVECEINIHTDDTVLLKNCKVANNDVSDYVYGDSSKTSKCEFTISSDDTEPTDSEPQTDAVE